MTLESTPSGEEVKFAVDEGLGGRTEGRVGRQVVCRGLVELRVLGLTDPVSGTRGLSFRRSCSTGPSPPSLPLPRPSRLFLEETETPWSPPVSPSGLFPRGLSPKVTYPLSFEWSRLLGGVVRDVRPRGEVTCGTRPTRGLCTDVCGWFWGGGPGDGTTATTVVNRPPPRTHTQGRGGDVVFGGPPSLGKGEIRDYKNRDS